MSHTRIPVAYQAPLYDHKTFLAPLQTPEAQSIIRAAEVDTPRVTKYTVERVFRLYLFAALLKGVFHSLRGIVSLKDNLACRLFVGLSTWSLQGLSDANHRISFQVFQTLYTHLSTQVRSRWSRSAVEQRFGPFKIFDCTHFQLALKLMPWGKAQNQRVHKGQLKCAVRLDGVAWVPDRVNLDAQVSNDNTHFAALIDWTHRGVTYLFDRGFRKLDVLVKLQESGNFFITRLHQGTHVTVIKELLYEPLRHGPLTLLHDQCVRLGSGKRTTLPLFRLITARSLVDGQETLLFFLTNRFDLTPEDITDIYRYRWQIEAFFKWLKSALQIDHFFSYSENGVYLQIYVTLIVHLLLLLYHQSHQIAGTLGVLTQRHVHAAVCNLMLLFGIQVGMQFASCLFREDTAPPGRHLAIHGEPLTIDISTS